jgi:DNA helicase II / ATP-dependent DNA helicase PcrA
MSGAKGCIKEPLAGSIARCNLPQLRNICGIVCHYRQKRLLLSLRTRGCSSTELTLDPPDATSGRAGADLKDEDYTVLSTIHSAKGQEWRIVRILNAVDGCIPSDRATGTSEEIEEERRLLYVAMTRAKDELDVIVPQRFFTHQQAKLGDRHVYASRSRFIPDSILGSFATRNWRDQTDGPIKIARQAGSSVDVAASLMRMWR